LKGFKGSVACVAISQDGTRIVTGGAGVSKPGKVRGEATVWDARTGAPIVELKGLNQPVESVAFSPDGTRIVTAGGQRLSVQGGRPRGEELKVWHATTGTVLLDVAEQVEPGMFLGQVRASVAFSPEGRRFVVGGMRTVNSPPNVAKVRDAGTGAVLV